MFRGGRGGGGGGFRGGRGSFGRDNHDGGNSRSGESSLGFRTIGGGGGVRGGKRGGNDSSSFRGSRGRGGNRRTSFGDYGDREQDDSSSRRNNFRNNRNQDDSNNNDDDDDQQQNQQQQAPSKFSVPAGFGKQFSEMPQATVNEDQYYNHSNTANKPSKAVQEDAAAVVVVAPPANSNILELGQGGNEVRIQGTSSLRYAVVCSILTNKPITFILKNSNNGNTNASLPSEAVSFLRLISQITTGSKFSLAANGSELKFVPGLITASGAIVHEYNPPAASSAAAPQPTSEDASSSPSGTNVRSLGYFVEPLLLLLPFSRRATSVTLVGPSHGDHDVCPHTLRTVTTRIAQAFGIECNLRIVRHSGKTSGCVILNVTPARKLKPVKLLELGFISRVRGIAFGADVSADLPQRAAVAAKGALLNFLPDVYVVTDIAHSPKTRIAPEGGASSFAANRQTAAFGVMLVAETTTKRAVVSQECCAAAREDPDVVGKRAVQLLLDEVSSGCCVDRHHQSLTLMLMALAPDDVSTVRFGHITAAGLSTLDLMEKFLSVRPVIKDAQVEEAPEAGVIVSCFGSATINLTKRSG